MGSIFSQAQQVYIWLDPEDEVTAKMFEFFREVSKLPDMNEVQMEKPVRPPFSNDAPRGLQRPICSSTGVLEPVPVRTALGHPGDPSCPCDYRPLWELLPLFVFAIFGRNLDSENNSVILPIKMMSSLSRPMVQLSILKLLWNFHDAICLEPKDRIAALFGLVSEDNRSHLGYSFHWTGLYK